MVKKGVYLAQAIRKGKGGGCISGKPRQAVFDAVKIGCSSLQVNFVSDTKRSPRNAEK